MVRHGIVQVAGDAQALADAMGPSDPTFDMKAWTDAMWDER